MKNIATSLKLSWFAENSQYEIGKSFDDIAKSLGETIAICRIDKGLTQSQLAEKLQISSGRMKTIENGKIPPSLNLLYAIANALDLQMILPKFREKFIDDEIHSQ